MQEETCMLVLLAHLSYLATKDDIATLSGPKQMHTLYVVVLSTK